MRRWRECVERKGVVREVVESEGVNCHCRIKKNCIPTF